MAEQSREQWEVTTYERQGQYGVKIRVRLYPVAREGLERFADAVRSAGDERSVTLAVLSGHRRVVFIHHVGGVDSATFTVNRARELVAA